jgi:GntR family transcriptional regulator, rspAB operon transcriptional repressor
MANAKTTAEPIMLIRGLRDQIVDQLRNDVFSGRLPPGERLSETSLVDRFRVSRTPIREALQQLTQEGLLEAKPNCGVRVADDASDALDELVIPIRRTIETFALRSCFDEIDGDDFARWEELLGRMGRACREPDFPAIAELDLAFHRSIIQRAGIRDLETIWLAIVARVRFHFLRSQREYAEPMDIRDEHASIVAAIRSGDAEAAVEALGANIA